MCRAHQFAKFGNMAYRVAHPFAIQELRTKAKISSSALARAAGIGRSTLYRIEKGTQQPTPETIDRIAEALKVRVEAITYPVERAA